MWLAHPVNPLQIDFVHQDVDVVVVGQTRERLELLPLCQRPRWIVQIGDDDQPRARRQCALDTADIEPVAFVLPALERAHLALKILGHRSQRIVARALQQYLIVGGEQRGESEVIGHRRPVGEHDVLVAHAVPRRNSLEQRRPAVLVVRNHREVVDRRRQHSHITRRDSAHRQVVPDAAVRLRPLDVAAGCDYRGAPAATSLLCGTRFCDAPSDATRVTVSLTALRIFSNCLPAIQSWGATHGPPHATTFLSARYVSKFAPVMPPLGLNSIPPNGPDRRFRYSTPPSVAIGHSLKRVSPVSSPASISLAVATPG